MKRLPVSCPISTRWLEVAAGTQAAEIAAGLMEHAAECEACASLLREAIRVMADEGDAAEASFLGSLRSSQPDWQKQLARELSAVRQADTVKPWWKYRATWVLAAAIVMVALVAILVPWRREAPGIGEKTPMRDIPVLTAAVVLNPVTTRDVGDVVELKMSTGIGMVDVSLQSVDAFPRPLSVQVLDASEREVARAEFDDATQGQVTLHIPASDLPPGDYHISAAPVTSGSGKRVSYGLRVTY